MNRPRRVLHVGTRGSTLARRQTDIVISALQALDPDLSFEVKVIRTLGDESVELDLSQFEGQGVFVRTIETNLLNEQIDLAVHSFKDMPSKQPDGLAIGAFPPREDARDALVARDGLTLQSLPYGSLVGTGSPRRRALLRTSRPDLEVQPIRGNVDTRLRRVANGDFDAVVVAAAGLARLGRSSEITQVFDPWMFVPAIGQGLLAIEARANDRPVLDLLARLDDPEARACAIAERAVAEEVGAGCQLPLGAYAQVRGSQLVIDAFMADSKGARFRVHQEGPPTDAAEIGKRAGEGIEMWREAMELAALGLDR